MDIKPGRYQHFKGGIVEVIGIAKHSETLEELIVYKCHYECRTGGKGSLWVRPKEMFEEEVSFENKKVPRFKYLGEDL